MTTTVSPPLTLHTERLELRVPQLSDAAELYSTYTGSLDAAKYLQRRPHRSVIQTEQLIQNWGAAAWSSNRRRAWLITTRQPPAVIGLFILLCPEHSAELHFGLAPSHWGRGYATEAGRAVMAWIGSVAHIRKAETVCDCENKPALNVLTKLGLLPTERLPEHLALPHFASQPRDCWRCTWARD